MKELFSVTVFVNNYTHGVHIYNNLRIAIIRATGNQSLYDEAEYREMIEGYDDLDETSKTYSKGCIDENFTKDEAEKVRAYFKILIEKGEKITIRKAELPIPGNYMPTGAISVGGDNDLIEFYKSKSYPLEFKILGYYNILNLKPVDVDKQKLEKEMAEVKVEEEPLSKVRQKMIKAYEKKYPGENIKLLKEEKCHVKSCKNEPTIFARFFIDRYALGLRGDQGASITVCTVVTCAKHSFKDNRNLLQKYMDRLRKDAIEFESRFGLTIEDYLCPKCGNKDRAGHLIFKDGNPLIVTKYEDKKTGRMRGKDGRIIWDGKNFIFVPEKVKL